MPDRAVVFIDGNNWYHGLKGAGIDPGSINLLRVAKKLAGPREITAIRYYIGEVKPVGNTRLSTDQQAFFARLRALDGRFSIHLGRLEPRWARSEAAKELLEYMASLRTRIDQGVYKDLVAIGDRHRSTRVMTEKGVDVMMAVDLVVMAERDEFDTAYLLTADGDYTHAVEAVRAHRKKVFAAAPSHGAQLAATVNAYIHCEPNWFDDCLI